MSIFTFRPNNSVGVHPKTCSTESLADWMLPPAFIVMIGSSTAWRVAPLRMAGTAETKAAAGFRERVRTGIAQVYDAPGSALADLARRGADRASFLLAECSTPPR